MTLLALLAVVLVLCMVAARLEFIATGHMGWRVAHAVCVALLCALALMFGYQLGGEG